MFVLYYRVRGTDQKLIWNGGGKLVEKDFYSELSDIVSTEQIKKDELLARHTTFRIGGPADYFVTVTNAQKAAEVLKLCSDRKVPYFVIGNGSNLLVSDKGYRGVIIKFTEKLCSVWIEEQAGYLAARAGAGAALAQFAREVARQKGAGFEFAAGIPGSVGGAVYMNAGAYGGEIKDSLTRVRVMDRSGNIMEKEAAELELSYRSSRLSAKGWYVLEAEFQFEMGKADEILQKIEELSRRRSLKQPLEYPSAGSTFKRPEGSFAGKLIMEAGLAGLRVGGAQISTKHCGFIVNTGRASACDVMRLIHQVQKAVREKFEIDLEPEIRLLGEI